MGDKDNTNWGKYMDHIGLFFFFVACAGVSIIVWIFNWVCWLNQCCCCDFLHNPVNKRIAWWTSFSFLLGVLACCISAFVSVNRFGFTIDGAWCAFDRIYYDSLYGQLKNKGERWEGLDNTGVTLQEIKVFCNFIINLGNENIEIIQNDYYIILKESCSLMEGADESGNKIIIIKDLPSSTQFENIKGKIHFDKITFYAGVLKRSFKILAMIYYCLLLIATTGAGIAMMFYACLKKQGYLITFMHVSWNVIRFFIFSFFLYGTAFGVLFLMIRDLIACMHKIFSQDFGGDEGKFLHNCLFTNETKFLNETIKASINSFFAQSQNDKCDEIVPVKENPDNQDANTACHSISEKVENGTLGSFDCRFLQSNLDHLYSILSDSSKESRKLSALSLCSAFFGAVAVYFYLLVIHHYNNELFFDYGKSIFTGFDGFGRGFTKRNKNEDPAYKKRKLRAEIELTSKNEEDSP